MKSITILISLLAVTFLHAQPAHDGYEISKHPNGANAAAGFYEKGKKDGLWKYWTDEGKLSKTETYRKGLLNGWYRTYFSSDSTAEEWFYTNGKLDSSYKKYNEAGSLLESGHYLNDKKRGEWNYFKTPVNGAGVVYTPQPKGSKRVPPVLRKIKTAHYAEDLLDGDYMEWNDWGGILQKGKYRKGKKSGRFENADSFTWQEFENDTLVRESKRKGNGIEEYGTKNGKKNGSYIYREPYNVVRIEGNYKDDIRHGHFTEYRNTGIKWLEYNYNEGILDGEKREYDANGKLILVCHLANGIFSGNYTTYYPEGKLKEKWVCVNGNFEGVYFRLYPDGKTAESGTYRDDMREGVFSSYDNTGRKTSSCNYHEGMRNGTYTEWNADGGKRVEARFVNDSLAGDLRLWSANGKALRGPQLGRIFTLNSLYNYGYQLKDTLGELEEQIHFIAGLPLEEIKANFKAARYSAKEKEFTDELSRLLQGLTTNYYYYGGGLVVLEFDVTENGTMENLKVQKAYDFPGTYYGYGYGYPQYQFSQNVLTSLSPLLQKKWLPAEENGKKVKSHELLVIKTNGTH